MLAHVEVATILIPTRLLGSSLQVINLPKLDRRSYLSRPARPPSESLHHSILYSESTDHQSLLPSSSSCNAKVFLEPVILLKVEASLPDQVLPEHQLPCAIGSLQSTSPVAMSSPTELLGATMRATISIISAPVFRRWTRMLLPSTSIAPTVSKLPDRRG